MFQSPLSGIIGLSKEKREKTGKVQDGTGGSTEPNKPPVVEAASSIVLVASLPLSLSSLFVLLRVPCLGTAHLDVSTILRRYCGTYIHTYIFNKLANLAAPSANTVVYCQYSSILPIQ